MRVFNAAYDGSLLLKFSTNSASMLNETCSLMHVASDGRNLRIARELNIESPIIAIIPAGSRKDFLLTCDSSFNFFLESVQHVDSILLGPKSKILTGVIANFSVINHGGKPDLFKFRSADFQDSELDLRTTLEEDIAARFVFKYEFDGVKKSELMKKRGYNYSFYGVNGAKYSNFFETTVYLNRVNEWVIENNFALDNSKGLENHPFHLHTNHFQVVKVETSSQKARDFLNLDYQVGDFRDTITVPALTNVTIRFVPRDYIGVSLAHCHTLTHEDTGMMMAFEIAD